MSDEASHESCQQIVFLIDSNPSFWGSNYSAEDAAKAIRLCVLRVLTYFSDYDRGKRSNLRWGYKFFDSRSLSHQFERHDFKEFLVNVFEEFEDQVLKRLNESFAQQANAFEQKEQDGGELTSFSKPPAGARCISCAFTNVVHDFQWERPDISSPVRRTRGNNNSLYHDNRTKTRNVMFLLSGCPCNDDSISEFTGENSSSFETLEGLKSIVMPSVLYKEFKERRICLQWVNTGNCQQEKNTSLKLLLEATVEQLGGCLIPLSAVIYTGNNFSLGLNSTPSSGLDHSAFKSSIGQLLPFKTVMDFYFRGKATMVSAVVSSIAWQQDEMKMGCSDTTGLLCSSGTEEKVHCSVKLCSMFRSVTEQEGPSEIGNSSMTDQTADTAIKPSTSNDDKSITNLLWIRGVVNHTCVSPTWLHPRKGYSCIGLDDRTTNDSTNSPLCSEKLISGWYQELLLSLAKERKLLVVDFIDCDSGLPVTGVLQPLTSICGVISVIASDFLVTFEKLLLWYGKASMVDRKKVTIVETCHNLISNYRSKTVSKPAESLRNPEVFLGLTGSQNNQPDLGTTDVREFEARFVDPWCSFPVVDNRTGSFWNELKRGDESEEEEDNDDVDNEAALMKELKELYNKKETTSCNVSQLPKQSKKEKSGEKSEVQNASLKLRRNLRKETNADDQNSKLDGNESQPAVEKDKIDECSTIDGSQKTNSSTGMQQVPCDLKDEAELVKVIHDLCNKVILEGANILHEITNIVTIVSQFFVNGGNDRQKECVSQFLREHLLLTVSELREKYEGCSEVIRGGQQVREYQLQIMLQMEIAALTNADENSSLVEEVTVLLRAISFMKDPKFLTIYLREVLLHRYRHNLARFLCGVYEGLMMRPPREVSTPSKWSSDDESPIRRSVKSVSSTKQDSSQPRSSGCRVITRHLSVTDAGGKRREIVVPGRAKPKDKEKTKKEKPQGAISLRGASKKEEKKTRGQKTPVKQVRRNLFTESEEGDENNSTARVPRNRKLSEGEKKEHARRRFHRRNTVGSFSKSAVQETPAHKQVSKALWCKQDRARKRSRAHTEVHVLQESPLKELQTGEGLPRRSPRRPPVVSFQRSQSFYGRSASAGPLTRTRSFSGAYSRDTPKKEPMEGSDSIPAKEALAKKTPQKKLPSVAFSPLRFSPRQKKKFSLHSLLRTSKECDQKRESLPGRQKPTTPKRKLASTATRSSPRLLKKRSFSCIGFSSVPFPEAPEERKFDPLSEKPRSSTHTSPSKGDTCMDADSQEGLMKTPKKEKTDNLSDIRVTTPTSHRSSPRLLKQRSISCVGFSSPEEMKFNPLGVKPRSRDNTSRTSPVKEDTYSDVVLQEGVMTTPNKQKSDKLSDIGATTPKFTTAQSEKRTPLKDYHMDECVVLLTPIRKPLMSPLHVSPKVIADLSSYSQSRTHQDVIESLKQEDPAQGANENARTPVKNGISPGFRSSPRLLCKHNNTETSLQTSRESLCKPGDSQPISTVSLKSTQTDLAKSTTPVKVCHLDDCVVLLTPIKRLSKSPAHLRSQEKNVMGTCSDSERTVVLNENLGTNKVAVDADSGLLSKVVYTGSKSPQSSPRTTIKSGRVAVIERRMRKKPPMINSESTGAETEGTEWFSCLNTLTEGSDKCRNNSATTEGAERIARHAYFQEDEMFPRSTRASPTGAQLLWSQRPQNSTPPPKRSKKKSHVVSNSPAETKRLSPLNQILRQQKRKRCFSASPADKCSREASEVYTRDTSSCVRKTPNKKASKNKSMRGGGVEKLSLFDESCALTEDNSRSSEEADDWLSEMEKEFDRSLADTNEAQKSPATKRRRIDKSVVFGGKRARKESTKKPKSKNVNSSLSSDTSYEEDDEVFQSPAVLASRLRSRHLNKTPLSASSIKVLQESPILLDGELLTALSPRNRSYSDVSPNYQKRDRKRLVDVSNYKEASISKSFTDDQEEPIARPLRKRLKLQT